MGTELGETVAWRFIGGTTVEAVVVLVKTSVTSVVAVSDSMNVVT